jgi:hypothetical protein
MYIGIDNGVSASIGVIFNNNTYFFKTPTKSEQNYTKDKKNITRIDVPILKAKLMDLKAEHNPKSIMCLIERPMVNPTRFQASVSAIRSLEATILTLEALDIPYQYEDSKKWQKALLPNGVSGSVDLKEASKDIGCRLFPDHKELITKHKDADGILLAEYCRRTFN